MTWLEELVPVFIVGFFAVDLVLERAFAARPIPRVRGWNLRAGLGFVVTLAVNAVVPMLRDRAHRLHDAEAMGVDLSR